jgi:hypothetical protein
MPSQPELPNEGSSDPSSSTFNRGSQGDVQMQIAYLLFDIRENLRDSRKSQQDERIQQLIEGTTKLQTTLSGLKETVEYHRTDLKELTAVHTKDLNELGRRLEREIGELKSFSGTAGTIGKIALVIIAPVAAAIIYAITVHVYHAVEKLLF